jgi:hypothetical protein
MVYENREALPRARLAFRCLRVPGAREALYEASGAPAGDTVWVEGPADWEGFRRDIRASSQARVTEDAGTRLVCDVPGDGTRVLLLADTWEPGWRAYSSGRRLAVLPADCMFRAVAVPSGSRRVVFNYEPIPFKLGLLIGGLTAGGLAVWILAAVTVQARRRPGWLCQPPRSRVRL